VERSRTSSRFGTLPREELEVVCNAVKDTPWRQVIENTDLPVLKQKRSWFINPRKGYPYRILPLVEKGVALDIGAGSGIISSTVAQDFSSVVAFDYSPELVAFMKKRFLEDGLNGIHLVRGDAVNLPFHKECFDLVIVNGVLEWVPDFVPKMNPCKAQIEFLTNVRTILRRKGMVGIAIENRLYYRHFQGMSSHGESSYTVILPRFLTNLIRRLRKKSQYRNYIYSYWGYRHLLKKAGYRNVQIYLVLPSYYDPHMIISTQKKPSQAFFEEYFQDRFSENGEMHFARKAIYYLLNKINLFRYLEHSFLITAEK
jgi:SAM-dependent methyltransferase